MARTIRKPQPLGFSTSLTPTLLANRRARHLAELIEHLRAVPGWVMRADRLRLLSLDHRGERGLWLQ